MARRRSKKFGSTSTAHVQQASYAQDTAYMHVENAVRGYAAGKCLVAGGEIDKAYVAIGKATAHLTSADKNASAAAKSWDRLDHVKAALKAIDHKFEKSCVKKSPT